jgi:hypothetical protein
MSDESVTKDIERLKSSIKSRKDPTLTLNINRGRVETPPSTGSSPASESSSRRPSSVTALHVYNSLPSLEKSPSKTNKSPNVTVSNTRRPSLDQRRVSSPWSTGSRGSLKPLMTKMATYGHSDFMEDFFLSPLFQSQLIKSALERAPMGSVDKAFGSDIRLISPLKRSFSLQEKKLRFSEKSLINSKSSNIWGSNNPALKGILVLF